MKTKVTGGFWKDYQELVRKEVIPYQWNAINDLIPEAEPSHAIKNFKIAADLEHGDYYGTVFQDSDVGKWLEAVAYSLANKQDSHLESLADSVIDILEKAQLTDGYLNTYYMLKEGVQNRFTNVRDNHELYCAGHLLEAAVAYYKTTGKEKFLNIMIRYVDHIATVFGPGEEQIHGYPGHPELELALIRLYEVTGEKRFLELAAYFIEERGKQPYYYEEEAKKRGDKAPYRYTLMYSQAHKPVRKQETAVGHAVRAVYLYSAIADLVRLTDDQPLKETCEKLWNSITGRQMYVTRGIGSDADMEAFSFDYDLPNDLMYNETCASIGLIFFAHRMSKLSHDSKYADEMERALYNGVLSGMSLDGKSFFYVNPMEVYPKACGRKDKKHVKAVRKSWFGTACCPPNISRLISSIGDYAVIQEEENVYFDLFMNSETNFDLSGKQVLIKTDTSYPWNGTFTVDIQAEENVPLKLNLRIPYWCEHYTVTLNGEKLNAELKNGYLAVEHIFCHDQIKLELEMSCRKVYAKSSIRYDNYKVCLQRGPLIYCVEEADLGALLDAFSLSSSEQLSEIVVEELKPGAVYLTGKALRLREERNQLYSFNKPETETVNFQAIPYFMWGNRKKGEMKVWINAAL